MHIFSYSSTYIAFMKIRPDRWQMDWEQEFESLWEPGILRSLCMHTANKDFIANDVDVFPAKLRIYPPGFGKRLLDLWNTVDAPTCALRTDAAVQFA
jgi:hypothetical protein